MRQGQEELVCEFVNNVNELDHKKYGKAMRGSNSTGLTKTVQEDI